MELIRLFMGILLSICLIFYINSSTRLDLIIKMIEQREATDSIKPLGLQLIDFNGKVRVENVLEYTPAQKAGIEPGDKILEINGIKIKNVENFFEVIESPRDNTTIKMVVYRPHCNSKFPLEVDSSGGCILKN